MASTRSSSRKGSSPAAPLSRIPVYKGSKVSVKGATNTATTTRQRRKVATVSSSTRVLRSSIGNTPTGANKENIPFFPRRRFHSRANPASPSRMRRDGLGKKPFGQPSKTQRPRREPLRELTEAEIFERDEAVMGDLRRRRASGDNYIVNGAPEAIIFDTSLAQDTAAQDTRLPEPEQSAPVEPESPLVIFRPTIERFQVLRTSGTEETPQTDVMNTIIAAAASTSVDFENRPRTRAALAQKQQHPAMRTSLSSIENNSPDVMLRSAEASPINPLRARVTRFSSPCSGTMVHAGISKAQPSPSPLKVSRMGLGTKSTNTVMKRVLEEGGKLGDGSKIVIKDTTVSKTVAKKRTVTTTTTTSTTKPKATARKASSSLKRAAGVTNTVSTSARAGLANIGRMR